MDTPVYRDVYIHLASSRVFLSLFRKRAGVALCPCWCSWAHVDCLLLQVAIDILALSWTEREKARFIEELEPACLDAQTALAAPLLDVVRLALKQTFEQKKEKSKREKKDRQEEREGDEEGEKDVGVEGREGEKHLVAPEGG